MTLHGLAPSAPPATATEGTVGTVHYDAASHLFSVDVAPGTDHNSTAALVAR